ncbi:10273_t:CDS:1, partial [Gigaspora margarita]
NAWSKLYHSKKRFPTIPILAITITLAYEDNSENVVTICETLI